MPLRAFPPIGHVIVKMKYESSRTLSSFLKNIDADGKFFLHSLLYWVNTKSRSGQIREPSISFSILSMKGLLIIPFSVIIAVMFSAGVTSNEGL